MTNIDQLYTVEDHEKGAEMQVRDQVGKPLDMFITVIGVDSKRWRKTKTEASRKLLEDKADPDKVIIDSLVEATIDWRGFMSEGKELDFTKKKVRQLYQNAPYIAEQVDRFIADRANFIKS